MVKCQIGMDANHGCVLKGIVRAEEEGVAAGLLDSLN